MSFEQKSPLAKSLNDFAEQKINDAMQLVGKNLPCSVTEVQGSIVTVKFELYNIPFTLPPITIPVFGPEYIRYPIQVGDKGFCVAPDASLRSMSGLGTGIADLTQPASLSSLVFFPIGNKNWFSVNGQYLVMYGPDGVILSTSNMDCMLTLTHDGITINLNGGNLVINSGDTTMNGNLTVNGLITGTEGFNISGGDTTAQVTGNVDITGTLTNNGKLVGSTHTHSGVQTGSGNTGAPN